MDVLHQIERERFLEDEREGARVPSLLESEIAEVQLFIEVEEEAEGGCFFVGEVVAAEVNELTLRPLVRPRLPIILLGHIVKQEVALEGVG